MALPTDAKTGQAIFAGATRSGLRNVGSYQVSGHPYITGSTIATNQQHTITFPYVTKEITVMASGSCSGELRIHFHETGSANRVEAGNHYILLEQSGSVELDVKCKQMYISTPDHDGSSGGYTVYASLTTILTESMFDLSGSGVTD